MALIKCPECGKEVSNSATSCPNCGYPLDKGAVINNQQVVPPKAPTAVMPPKRKNGCATGCLIMVIIFALIGVIVVAVGVKSTGGSSSSTAAETTTQFNKSSAEELDKEIWDQLLNSIKAQNNLMAAMADYSDGRLSEVDFYDYCKEISKFAASASMAYPDSDNEGAKAYIDSCETYAYYLQMTADSLIKYIDSKATKDLSKAKENIENMQKAVSIALQNRGAFLITAGYTQEEVEQIANEAVEAIDATEAQ